MYTFRHQTTIMKIKYLALLLLAFTTLNAGTAIPPVDVTLDFQNNLVTGGTLVLLETGSDPTNNFTGDRFDELASAAFEIQGISGFGTLGGTANSLVGNLNVTTSGLQDGSSGYGAASEGTAFVFDEDVTIEFLDWVSFTTDSVELFNNNISLGTFTTGTNSGGINFTDSNPSLMSIFVNAGEEFKLQYSSGNFFLGQMGFNVVPEPSTYALLSGICALGFVMLRRRN